MCNLKWFNLFLQGLLHKLTNRSATVCFIVTKQTEAFPVIFCGLTFELLTVYLLVDL